jgi:hypothetical protein
VRERERERGKGRERGGREGKEEEEEEERERERLISRFLWIPVLKNKILHKIFFVLCKTKYYS